MRLVLTFLILFTAFSIKAQNFDTPTVLQNDTSYLYLATFKGYLLGGIHKPYLNPNFIQDTNAIPQRIKNNAKILSKGGFDLICLQGLVAGKAGENAVKDLIWGLNNVYGYKYKYIVSNSIGKAYKFQESIAFLWDSTRVLRKPGGAIIDAGKGLDFVKTYWKSGDFDFTLIGLDLSWGSGTYRREEDKKIDEILHNINNYSKDPDVIILGNFNRFGNGQKGIKEIKYESGLFFCPNVQVWDPHFNKVEKFTTEHAKGLGLPKDNPDFISTTCGSPREVFDLIICSQDVMEEYQVPIENSRYDRDYGVLAFDHPHGTGFILGTQLYGSEIKEYYSDHRPVWVRFKRYTGNLDE